MKLYDKIQFICFTIEGKGLNPRKVNPVLSAFHDHLLAFRYNYDPWRIHPEVVDDLVIEPIDTTLLLGQYSIKWSICDIDEAGAIDRLNNSIEPLLTNEIMKIQMDNGMRYGKRISVAVTKSRFQGEVRQGRWPRDISIAVVTA